jgi:hypothetical protein
MKRRDLINLLNNAAAVIETGDGCGLSQRELADVADDLLNAAKELSGEELDGTSGQDRDSYSA